MPKMLILGTSESGKSTLFKQLKFLYDGKFNQPFGGYNEIVHSNICYAFKTIISRTESSTIGGMKKEEAEALFCCDDTSYLNFVEKIKCIWNDPLFQQTLEQRHASTYFYSISHFFKRLDVISKDDYEAEVSDIVRS